MDNNKALAGYRAPPKASQFKPGQSGNPRGRPTKQPPKPLPHALALDMLVTVTEGGHSKRIPAGRALAMMILNKVRDGDAFSYKQWKRLSEKLPGSALSLVRQTIVEVEYIDNDEFHNAAKSLEIIVRTDPSGPNTKFMIPATFVQAALRRLTRPLTLSEQELVWNTTLTPKKVKWPEWWSYEPPPSKPAKRRNRAKEQNGYD